LVGVYIGVYKNRLTKKAIDLNNLKYKIHFNKLSASYFKRKPGLSTYLEFVGGILVGVAKGIITNILIIKISYNILIV
jgi:F0F1-type ATP synthase assembly protein I